MGGLAQVVGVVSLRVLRGVHILCEICTMKIGFLREFPGI